MARVVLPVAGDVLKQQVPPAQQTGDREPHQLALAQDDTLHGIYDPLQRVRGGVGRRGRA